MDPPQCVQNAMMTKDKKPFTYTPGGIDLSEVRSPRMQRRIERNANLGGAGDMPQPPQPHHQNVGPLPPAALAAMRPQTQVMVLDHLQDFNDHWNFTLGPSLSWPTSPSTHVEEYSSSPTTSDLPTSYAKSNHRR